MTVLAWAAMNDDKHPLAWGRRNDRGLLVLVSLAESPKHGYALLKDIEDFADVRLSPGTLYSAIARLEEAGLVEPEPVGASERRRPYRLTMAGRAALSAELEAAAALSRMGLRRLQVASA
jgi:DNA-binding PadR family transcriptional regulator